jgi:hypothetical protein
MLQRVLVLGLFGPFALIGGCTSEQSASNFSAGRAAKTTPATEQMGSDKNVQTKQITLSVPGMT